MGLVICATSLVLATLAYSGGSLMDRQAGSFSLREGFLSDLGRIRGHGDVSNLSSHVLFMLSTVSGSATLVGLAMQRGTRRVTHWSWNGMLLAISIVTAASVVAIGVTPWDYVLYAHGVAVSVAFTALPVLVALLAINGYRAGERVMWAASLMLLPLLVSYFVLLWFGPGFETHSGLVTQAIAQKIVVLGLLIWASTLVFWPKTTQKP